MIRIAAVAVVLAMTAVPCLAAEEAAAPSVPAATATEPSADAVATAEQIIEVTGAKQNSIVMVDAMIPGAIRMIKMQTPDIPDSVLDLFKTAFRSEVEKSLPAMLHAEARLYAMHFTVAELNDLLVFYRTPLGQKMLVEQPKIFTEIVPLSKAWGRQVGIRAMQGAIDSLRQEGVKI